MQIIKRQEKVGNILFSLAILLELLIMMTDQVGYTLPLRGRIAQLAFVLFGCKILTTRYSMKQWVVIAIIGILGCISYLTCREEYVLRAAVMVLSAKDIDVKRVLKLILYTMAGVTLTMMILSLTGIHGELIDVRHFGRGGVESRWKFGFSHPNNIHDNLWYMTACYLLIRGRKADWKDYAVITAMNVGLFILTVSRNGFLATQILVCACAFFRYLPKTEKQLWPYITGLIDLVACLFLTVKAGTLCSAYDPFYSRIDRLLTGRMEMVWEFAPVSSWTWFPGSRSLSYVDNGFAAVFYSYGIVIGMGYLMVMLYLFYRVYREQNGVKLAVLVTTIFVTFMESTYVLNVSLLYNLILILLFNAWYMGKEESPKPVI